MTRTVDVGLRSERGPILAALMLTTALIAIDTTIIAAIVPAIVDDVGGFSEFPWLFSVYLVAQACMVPLCGKLADLIGRKPIMLAGIAVFLLGSLLCGIAWSMPMLIACRAIQGLGAGAVQPMSMTIVGDLYSVRERAKVQGYIASVWAVASVAGPLLGSAVSHYVSWRWVFLINLPICAVAAWVLVRRFDEQVVRIRPRIDYVGSILLTSGCCLLLLGVLQGGRSWAWSSVTAIAILGSSVVLLAVFLVVEGRAAEPVIPLWMFRRRLLVTTNLVSFCVGAVLLGLMTWVPTFVQVVLNAGPLVSGLALGALILGWPISASQAGWVYLRIGFRKCALLGCGVAVFGSTLLVWLDASSSVLQVSAICLVIGLGMGLVAAPMLIAAQAASPWNERGVVTSTNVFSRTMGSALGAAVLGAAANAELHSRLGAGAIDGRDPVALAAAAHVAFIGVLAISMACLVGIAFMPRRDVPVASATPDGPAGPVPVDLPTAL